MDNKTEEVTEIEKDLDTAIAEEEAVVEETQEENIDEVVETDSESETEEVTLDEMDHACLLYTSPSPRDLSTSRMPSSA